jgi:calcineurin-like phosphoesterase
VYLQGVVIDIDDTTGRARGIERVRQRLPGT